MVFNMSLLETIHRESLPVALAVNDWNGFEFLMDTDGSSAKSDP
jgi:hypothetical protein